MFKDNRVIELVDMAVGLLSISCLYRNREDGFQQIFSRVYGPIEKKKEIFLGGVRVNKGIAEWSMVCRG